MSKCLCQVCSGACSVHHDRPTLCSVAVQYQGSKYFYGYEGYFQQNFSKGALVVHFTTHSWELFCENWGLIALSPMYFESCSISTWAGWPNGVDVCFACGRLWVRFLRQHIPQFFLSGYGLCRSRFMLSKFNCYILGWKTVPFMFMWFFIGFNVGCCTASALSLPWLTFAILFFFDCFFTAWYNQWHHNRPSIHGVLHWFYRRMLYHMLLLQKEPWESRSKLQLCQDGRGQFHRRRRVLIKQGEL